MYTKASKNREGKLYPSDINDKEWEILEPHVAQGAIGRPRKHNIRAIINAIRYIIRGMANAAKRLSAVEDCI